MTIETPPVAPILNPATSTLLAALDAQRRVLDAILREVQYDPSSPPGITKLSAVPFQTSKRFIVQWLVIAGSAAGSYGLRVGTADLITVQMGVADTKIIPLPYTIDSGKELSITLAGGAVLVDAFIIAETDETETRKDY